MATQRVYALSNQWRLVSDATCVYQVEGKGVECYFTESIEAPTLEPPKLQVARTVTGERVYRFEAIGGNRLWAYSKGNGATILVDNRSGEALTEGVRYSQATAFGELKVAEYDLIAAWLFPYNINSELIIQTTDNGGTVTQSGSFAVLQTSTATDGRAKIETRKALRYQTGIGGLVTFTATFTEGVANSLQVVGLGDDEDGFFFGYQDTVFGIFRRNGGVDNFTAISDWSEGIFSAFDPTLLNVYRIQFQWLGAGEIRFYVEDPDLGAFVLAHRIKYAGTDTDVTIQNPSLPIIAEVVNQGNATNLTVRTPSASAGLEGDADNPALKITRSVFGTNDNVGTSLEPIVSLRNPATYQGATNRLTLRGLLWTPASTGNGNDLGSCFLIRDATLTGASFSAVDANATPAESDTSATGITGGTTLATVVLGTIDSKAIPIKDLDIAIRPGETLTIAGLATGGPRISAGLTFESEV